MTDPTLYTDDDVRRLVALIDEGHYHDSAIHPGSMARHLLAAGVTLPPEPDTPAEPQERWEVVEGCVLRDAVEARRWDLGTAKFAHRIARLLNLDESVKDNACSGLHEAYPALVEELAEARAEVERWRVWREKATADARAEVERLTATLTAMAEPGLTADEFKASYVDIPAEGSGMERIVARIGPNATGGNAPITASHAGAIPTPDDATGRTDTATEPLFTGKLIGHSEYAGGGCEVVLDMPDWPGDEALRVKREVDVYPAGVRPAAPTITGEMVHQALGVTGALAVAADRGLSPFDVADALNRLLAEQGGEG